jgi:hypothetical protein
LNPWTESIETLINFNKIRIRDDDVLVGSRGRTGKEFERFRGFHNAVCQDTRNFIHIPAILVTEIQMFPDCIEYVKAETAAGRMEPEIHGLHHKDYANLSMSEVYEELVEARDWCAKTFNWQPTLWYSPHGAGADKRGAHLKVAAEEAGLTLVTCEGMIKPSALVFDVRAVSGRDKNTGLIPMPSSMTKAQLLQKWEGKEILRHWWEGHGALTESVKWFKENL